MHKLAYDQGALRALQERGYDSWNDFYREKQAMEGVNQIMDPKKIQEAAQGIQKEPGFFSKFSPGHHAAEAMNATSANPLMNKGGIRHFEHKGGEQFIERLFTKDPDGAARMMERELKATAADPILGHAVVQSLPGAAVGALGGGLLGAGLGAGYSALTDDDENMGRNAAIGGGIGAAAGGIGMGLLHGIENFSHLKGLDMARVLQDHIAKNGLV